MFKTYAGRVPAEVDLVCYWFEQAGRQIVADGTGRARREELDPGRREPAGSGRRHSQVLLSSGVGGSGALMARESGPTDGPTSRLGSLRRRATNRG